MGPLLKGFPLLVCVWINAGFCSYDLIQFPLSLDAFTAERAGRGARPNGRRRRGRGGCQGSGGSQRWPAGAFLALLQALRQALAFSAALAARRRKRKRAGRGEIDLQILQRPCGLVARGNVPLGPQVASLLGNTPRRRIRSPILKMLTILYCLSNVDNFRPL